ncbi:dehydrogenase [Ktedonobacteria bacterium brp13]|nr:dehydrogenase [Ktedonobacteria bacterium brp13]
MPQGKKIALITGANKGIGFEIARQLGEQGMHILVGARKQTQGDEAARRLESEGIEAFAVQLDVVNQSTVEAVAHMLEETYAKLDVLVNNAAIISPEKALPSSLSLAALRTTYETNVFGTFAMTQAMVPLLQRSEAGRIVNMSSGLASLGIISGAAPEILMAFNLAYCSSKTMVNAMTIFFAKELQQTGIKVNAADPGAVATEMNPTASRTPQQGAKVAVHLATLPDDGPTGGFFDENGVQPW